MTATKEKKAENKSAEKKEKATNIERRKIRKWLRCELTDDEKRFAAADLVNRMEEKRRKENELDAVKKQFNGEISKLDADVEAKKNLVRDGYEMRNVDCEEERDYDIEILRVTRMDTLKEIENRRLHNDELQRTLPGIEMEETKC